MNVFQIMAKILLDDKGYKKGLRDSEKDTKSYGERLKGGFKKLSALAAKAAVAGVSAAATGMAVLLKKSVQAYGEYEQLVGGVQKIFDQANISKIMEDANNAYIDLNMSANQYLATINQTGAAFAQTMGDQKGYDVARKGMKAIADYASGTGRNLEELNEKYSLITRSTSSYQSIADQFSGILPATSAAFLEQAQAAGFLSDSYTSLTEVPIDEYQEAVTNMLEKGVEDMGLLGNTAAESTKTVTGSLAMMKAAWENLVTGLSNPDADIGQLITNFVDSAEAAAKNLIPVIKNALTGVAQLITGLVPIIIAELPGIIDVLTNEIPPLIMAIGQAILDNADALGQAAVGLFLALNDGLYQVLPVLIEAVPVLIHALIDGFIQNSDLMAKCGEDLIKGLVLGLINAAKVLVKNIYKDVVKPMIDAFKDALGIASPSKVMMDIGKDVILGLIKGIKNKVKSIIETIVKVVKSIKEKFLELVKKGAEWGRNMIAQFKSGFANGIGAVLSSVGSLITSIRSKFLEIVSAAISWGQSIISNLASALSTGVSTLGSIAASIANNIKQKFLDMVSAVKGVGSKIVSGIASGLQNGLSYALSIAQSVANKIMSPFNNIKAKAPSWGSEFMDGLARGMNGSMWKVVNAATNAAQAIASRTHHTTPDVGPLKDDDKFMPDMMKQFAEGITKNAYLVSSAVEDAFDLGGIVTAGFSGATVSSAEVQRSGLVMTFADAVEAFKTALGEVAVELDDDEVGSFVRRTVVKSVYA